MQTERVSVVLVTYNRKVLLDRCLRALVAQTLTPSQIYVVDNASTDGTHEMLDHAGWSRHANVAVIRLPTNMGGAGGFHAGLRASVGDGSGWTWLLDDDALPDESALAHVVEAANCEGNIYGSLAVDGAFLSWPATLQGGETVRHAARFPAATCVDTIPFLGFLIHSNLVERIGLPDAGFFISADDIEYCLRARAEGSKIIQCGSSLIRHPKADIRTIKLGPARVQYLSLAAWKRYYDTRNRILIARKYYGFRLLTETLPGTLVRLVVAMAEPGQRGAQLFAFIAGTFDGLLGLDGRRHSTWGIKQ
jgi:GT2 family glycosyltransferase